MPKDRDTPFVRLLEQETEKLASFVLAMVADRHEADDLFQATCLELWRIRSKFRPGTDFGAWSRTVARSEIRRFWRRSSREKLAFSSEAVDQIANAYESEPAEPDREKMRRALDACLETLSQQHRGLLRRRYNDGVRIDLLARETCRTDGGLKMVLMRLRRKLAQCVEARLSQEALTDE